MAKPNYSYEKRQRELEKKKKKEEKALKKSAGGSSNSGSASNDTGDQDAPAAPDAAQVMRPCLPELGLTRSGERRECITAVTGACTAFDQSSSAHLVDDPGDPAR